MSETALQYLSDSPGRPARFFLRYNLPFAVLLAVLVWCDYYSILGAIIAYAIVSALMLLLALKVRPKVNDLQGALPNDYASLIKQTPDK